MSYPVDINDMCDRAFKNSSNHGFWSYDISLQDKESVRLILLTKMALVTSEVGEAVEALREEDYGNIKEEIADICIRLFDICGFMNINLQQAILTKMGKNESRPMMHGKKA
jgi:NTP pyrophosphatase (non-canonical NTP hydrolase)